jgi:hypothetical protein
MTNTVASMYSVSSMDGRTFGLVTTDTAAYAEDQ